MLSERKWRPVPLNPATHVHQRQLEFRSTMNAVALSLLRIFDRSRASPSSFSLYIRCKSKIRWIVSVYTRRPVSHCFLVSRTGGLCPLGPPSLCPLQRLDSVHMASVPRVYANCTVFFRSRNPTKTLRFLLPWISSWFFVGFLLSPPSYVKSFLRKQSFLVWADFFLWFFKSMQLLGFL